jgi:hypothetical protein
MEEYHYKLFCVAPDKAAAIAAAKKTAFLLTMDLQVHRRMWMISMA